MLVPIKRVLSRMAGLGEGWGQGDRGSGAEKMSCVAGPRGGGSQAPESDALIALAPLIVVLILSPTTPLIGPAHPKDKKPDAVLLAAFLVWSSFISSVLEQVVMAGWDVLGHGDRLVFWNFISRYI